MGHDRRIKCMQVAIMQKRNLKVTLGQAGFNFVQVQASLTDQPALRVVNFDFRPNTGKKPFWIGPIDVAAIGQAQSQPNLPFKGKIIRRPQLKAVT